MTRTRTKTDIEIASQIIKAASLETTGGETRS